MANWKKLAQGAAGAAGGAGLNVEDVFSTYLYTGNGSSQTITNGIDLAGEGGMVWVKNRDINVIGPIGDTERGTYNVIIPSETLSGLTGTTANITAFNSDGFSVGTGNYTMVNGSGYNYASWTFRKAPKFFDVVTWTGNGTSGRTISHNLEVTPAVIMVKCTTSAEAWSVYYGDNGRDLRLDQDFASSATNNWNSTSPTATEFTVGNNGEVNGNGQSYVAYLFAHNDGDGEFGPTGDQDIIKCGSYTGNGSFDGPEIDLGFEPQWLLVKSINSAEPWLLIDSMRGFGYRSSSYSNDGLNKYFMVDASYQEFEDYWFSPTSTGFKCQDNGGVTNGNGGTYAYIAIRRGPMAVPENADDVFAMDTFGGTSPNPPEFVSGFPVDMGIYKRTNGTENWNLHSRLIQGKRLRTNTTDAEGSETGAQFDYMNGYYDGTSVLSQYQSWMWRRAPNFFDVVAYSGNSTAGRTVSHNLGVTPEMIWIKSRTNTTFWPVYHKDVGYSSVLRLDSSTTPITVGMVTNTSATDFTLSTSSAVNSSGHDFIAYLFASLDGVSKVGSYTGTTSDVTVDCGFSNGARFVLIKRTDGAGNWWVFDTERGIVAGNDSALRLNSTAVEDSTFDYIDPHNSGFTVPYGTGINSVNTNGYSYIFYAIA